MPSREGCRGVIVTLAFADAVESTMLLAVSLNVFVPETEAGAVYKPLADTVPTAELPPLIPSTDHFTALLGVPETVAVNCCDCPIVTFPLGGETETAGVVV